MKASSIVFLPLVRNSAACVKPSISLVRNLSVSKSRSTAGQVKMDDRKGWNVSVSREATNTINPIRHCSEIHFLEPLSNCRKKEIFKVNIGE